jgi:hypothetical protein
MEGFAMQWQVLAETEAPKEPVHIRLFFWQGGSALPPAPEPGLSLFATATWTA